MSHPTDDLTSTVRMTIATVPRVFVFLWEVSPRLLVGLGLILVFNAVAPAALAWLSMKVLVNGVIEATTDTADWFALAVPLGAVFAIWVASSVLSTLDRIVRRLLQEKTEILESGKLLSKAGTLDIAFFETPRFYDQLHQAVENRWRVHDVANRSLSVSQDVVSFVAMVSLLAVLHPAAILLLLGTALPSLLMQARFARLRHGYYDEVVRGSRVQEYLHELLTSRHSASEVRIFSLADHFVGSFLRFANAQIDVFWKYERMILNVDIWLNLLSLAGTAAIWMFAVFQAVAGQITVGDLTLVFTASIQCRAQLDGLVSAIGDVFEGALGASSYFRFVDLDPGSVAGTLAPRRDPARSVPRPMIDGLALREVSFSYPESTEPVLDGVTLTIPSGSKVALVGENGAGKTTIVKLLMRLYDPTHGRVELDGRDLRDYDLADLRRSVSVVLQEFVRYEFSVADNIAFGDIDAIGDRDRIETAARRAGAHRLIENLPKGYDTVLGKTFDEGVDLSGGEWQFLAITRALMSDAQVLILDEPTAHLDALREQELYERFAALTEGRTVVFVSHRFSTVRMADMIAVIENGRVSESGSHDQLIAQDGKYAHMYRAQAARYA